MTRITIGEAGERAGLTAKAIRHYERRGLLPAPPRTDAGYRTYGDEDVAILSFIRQARALGMSLEEVRQILELQQGGSRPCEAVVKLLSAHIREIDETMSTLRGLRKTLASARDSARASREQGDEAAVCHIIERAGTPLTTSRL